MTWNNKYESEYEAVSQSDFSYIFVMISTFSKLIFILTEAALQVFLGKGILKLCSKF